MWTLAERTTIQALLKHEIPISVIIYTLLKNRSTNAWTKLKKTLKSLIIIAYLQSDHHFFLLHTVVLRGLLRVLAGGHGENYNNPVIVPEAGASYDDPIDLDEAGASYDAPIDLDGDELVDLFAFADSVL
jgi:hypothetical protein